MPNFRAKRHYSIFSAPVALPTTARAHNPIPIAKHNRVAVPKPITCTSPRSTLPEETGPPKNCSPAPPPTYCTRKTPKPSAKPSQNKPPMKHIARFKKREVICVDLKPTLQICKNSVDSARLLIARLFQRISFRSSTALAMRSSNCSTFSRCCRYSWICVF